jgi:hypothetical protein
MQRPECKELLASLGQREQAQGPDDAALIVTLAKFRQRLPQLFYVLKTSLPTATAPSACE